jgi:hypothetical protein
MPAAAWIRSISSNSGLYSATRPSVEVHQHVPPKKDVSKKTGVRLIGHFFFKKKKHGWGQVEYVLTVSLFSMRETWEAIFTDMTTR